MSDFQPKINLELTLPEVSAILETLGHVKYNQVAELITKIKTQATQQVAKEVSKEAE